MMKRLLLFSLCCLCLACDPAPSQSADNNGRMGGQAPAARTADASARNLTILTQDGIAHRFRVELAMTPEEQQKGLMNRMTLGDNAGMLFWFGNAAERGFWMKNTYIPLDILFIGAGGRITHIGHGRPQDLTTIRSNGPAIAVLEIPGGRAEELGIAAGDTVQHPFF